MATKKTKAAATGTTVAAAPALTAEPSSSQQAAVEAQLYLATDDTWSQRYWDPNDLHMVERELFGSSKLIS